MNAREQAREAAERATSGGTFPYKLGAEKGADAASDVWQKAYLELLYFSRIGATATVESCAKETLGDAYHR